MQRAEAALIGNLSTKLRLTPRSTFDRYTPKVVSRLPRPWELGGERSDPTAPLSNGLTFDEEARLNKSPEDEAPQPPPKPAA